MASNSYDPEQTNKERAALAGETSTNPQQHSQTLPLITEEIAANHSAPRTDATPAEHVTTPVMPPNPIRRQQQTDRAQPSGTGTARFPESPSQTQGAAVGAPATTVGTEAAEAKAGDGEEKKSEGRISATQLIAGAGAAATSSVIGGQLGVAGTVIGAGIASIVTGLAVTLYSRSLDKGKEKIKEVGSKLAPAVKAQIAKNPTTDRTALTGTTAAVPTSDQTHTGTDAASETEEEQSTWWQKLRRKRVLYPAAIGVAAFGIGLGGVVMAESFTDADLSPGTSQISRSVSGQSSTGDESGTDSGTSDSGSSDEGSGSGSQSGTDGDQSSTNGGTETQNGQSTSAGDDTGTQTTNTDGTDQGTDSTTGSGSETSGSTTADGTDTANGTSTSSGGSTSADSSGGSNSSSSSGGSNGSNSGSSGSGSGSGSSGSGSSGSGSSGSSGSGSAGSGTSGGGAASAQG